MATEFLTTEECMRLLGTQSVGRLAVVVADKSTSVRIIPNSVTGRRITQADLVYVEEGFEPETWSSLPV